MNTEPVALSPSEFYWLVKEHLETDLGEQWIKGEVNGFSINQNRLVFFDLKDEQVSVRCFMLIHELERVGLMLEDGMEIVVQATPSVFKRNTGFHLRVHAVRLLGAGALQKAYEQLKVKLAKEGLFDAERKRPMPRFPERIGVITSPDAAAWTDFQKMAKNRMGGLTLRLFPVSVQGLSAPDQIVRAFAWFHAHPEAADVLVLTRGGGSLEDLWAFNDERVARAVFSSRIPVVVGVGHERDETLADFVADVRASTPSNAAERIVPNRDEVRYQVDRMIGDQEAAFVHGLAEWKHRLSHAAMTLEAGFHSSMQSIRDALQRFELQQEQFRSLVVRERDRVIASAAQLSQQLLHHLHLKRDAVAAMERAIQSLNPLKLLSRGYALSFDQRGRVITSAAQVQVEEEMNTRFAEGRVLSMIKKKFI